MNKIFRFSGMEIEIYITKAGMRTVLLGLMCLFACIFLATAGLYRTFYPAHEKSTKCEYRK